MRHHMQQGNDGLGATRSHTIYRLLLFDDFWLLSYLIMFLKNLSVQM